MVSMLQYLPQLLILVVSSAAPLINAQRVQGANLSLGSSLTAAIGASWPSPSGRFAFGFYPKAQGLAVGVWLATTPNATVVWTANRDDPAITDGAIRLTFDGRLIWSAPGGREKPISQASEPAAMAAMLDSGNFVLYNSRQAIIWSTFNDPTDTLLPGQRLTPGSELFSSVSETDRSTGRFRLKDQKDGNLVLYPTGSTDTIDAAYWDTGTFDVGFLLTLYLNDSGLLFLAANSGNFTTNIAQPKSSNHQNGTETYYRATIDADGILRLYSHSFGKSGGGSTTTTEWAAVTDPCLVKGTCGLNSYCVLANGETNCLCPPGFDFVDSHQFLLGCTKNFTGGDCTKGSDGETVSTTMTTMANTTWVDESYLILPSTTSIDDCQAACLADCFCEAALFIDGQCTKQLLPLRYGRSGTNDTAFIKVGVTSANNQSVDHGGEKNDDKYLVTGIALSGVSACLFIISGFLFFKHRNLRRYHRPAEYENGEEIPVRLYSYEELEKATDNFKQELGRGAFGIVFKGAVISSNGERTIAVKRLEKMVEDGEREFQREVKAIGRTHHRNLVCLLGFCNEGTNRLLVYEYMSNGSLANLLFKAEPCPRWEERARIAIDVAKGLQYLHEELETHIIHCDIKPQNILIDDNGVAKISDFGLAKLLMANQTRTFTGIRGTRGYLAPEWYKNAPITVKADVYSYGVVLLEIICCKRSMELQEAGHEATLSEWVYECFIGGELAGLPGDEAADRKEVERMVKVGLWCSQNEPVFRPSMKNVILMLEGNMEVPLPPPPSSFSL